MIGAPERDGDHGAAYIFEQSSDGSWTETSRISLADSIAVDENIAVTGLIGADYGAGTAAILERNQDSDSWSVKTIVLGKGSSVLEPITGNKVECTDGNAERYGCNNVDLLSFLPIDEIGGDRGVWLNDMWGWTDPKTGKEYALVERNEGTFFVDVTNPNNPVYVGTLPMTEGVQASVWCDIKVYDNHGLHCRR